MATISSVGGTSFHQQKPQKKAEQLVVEASSAKSALEDKAIDFVFIFKIRGITLSGLDRSLAKLFLNATKHKSVAEFSYNQLERELDRCQKTIYRSIKKLAALFTVELIRSRINSTGYCEHNILRIQRVPDFYQIINQLNKQ